MFTPRFSIRTLLVASVLIGLVAIPIARTQFLEWQRAQAKLTIHVIPVINTDAGSIAAVLREVYSDQIQGGDADRTDRLAIGVNIRGNSMVVSGPKAVIGEIRQLVSDLDAAAIAGGQVFGSSGSSRSSAASGELIEEALRGLLDSSSP